MPAIAIIIEFDPHPTLADTFLHRLEQDARDTRADDGCLRMEILRVRDDSGRIVLSELWRDQAAIEAHRSKPGHSHDWQRPLIRSKRVTVCDAVESS